MDSSFKDSSKGLESENKRLNKVVLDLAAKTGAIQKQITQKTKSVATATVNVKNANNAVSITLP